MLLLISLDPKKFDRDYKPFYAALKARAAKRVHSGVWVCKTDSSAVDVFEELKPLTHTLDRLLVIPVSASGNDYRSYNGANKISDLLKAT